MPTSTWPRKPTASAGVHPRAAAAMARLRAYRASGAIQAYYRRPEVRRKLERIARHELPAAAARAQSLRAKRGPKPRPRSRQPRPAAVRTCGSRRTRAPPGSDPDDPGPAAPLAVQLELVPQVARSLQLYDRRAIAAWIIAGSAALDRPKGRRR
jgi:hypothetical protein